MEVSFYAEKFRDDVVVMLRCSFETLGCIAVEFRTHWHNHRSRAAIAGLGAKQDGVLRNHDLWRDGTVRDVVVFSVIDREWPTVRLSVTEKLARRSALPAPAQSGTLRRPTP